MVSSLDRDSLGADRSTALLIFLYSPRMKILLMLTLNVHQSRLSCSLISARFLWSFFMHLIGLWGAAAVSEADWLWLSYKRATRTPKLSGNFPQTSATRLCSTGRTLHASRYDYETLFVSNTLKWFMVQN